MSKAKKAAVGKTMAAIAALKLLPPTKIRKMEDTAISTLATGVQLFKDVTLQWVMHTEKHGDYTNLRAWVQRLYSGEVEGLIVAGLVKWVHDNSPIRLRAENGVVEATKLKEGEAGYKPFDIATMKDQNPFTSAEVINRAQRAIEPFSIKMVKSRIASLKRQLEKAQKDGGRGVIGYPEVIRGYLDDLLSVSPKPVKVGKKILSYNPVKEEKEVEAFKAEASDELKGEAA